MDQPPKVCHPEGMARRETTVLLDDGVLEKLDRTAKRSGRESSQVVEEALERYLALEVVDRVWEANASSPLDPESAQDLAYAELRAARAERAG
jgi:predicted DNA-binding protein